MHSTALRSTDVLVAAAVVLVALAPASSFAGIRAGELSGTVTDVTGRGLPAAAVEARPVGVAGPIQTASTDSTGMFTLSAFELGAYDVTFSRFGFREVGCFRH